MKIRFRIDDLGWLRREYPEFAHTLTGEPFRCTYTLYDVPGKGTYYRLETMDGRTNYNDLNGYEKSLLHACFDYYSGILQTVFLPWTQTGVDYCLDIEYSRDTMLPIPTDFLNNHRAMNAYRETH